MCLCKLSEDKQTHANFPNSECYFKLAGSIPKIWCWSKLVGSTWMIWLAWFACNVWLAQVVFLKWFAIINCAHYTICYFVSVHPPACTSWNAYEAYFEWLVFHRIYFSYASRYTSSNKTLQCPDKPLQGPDKPMHRTDKLLQQRK